LLYKPLRTRKSSLSLSITSYFGLDIYILSLSAINNKASLRKLFAKLLSYCVILLEDINAISLKQFKNTKTKDSC